MYTIINHDHKLVGNVILFTYPKFCLDSQNRQQNRPMPLVTPNKKKYSGKHNPCTPILLVLLPKYSDIPLCWHFSCS